MTDSLAREITSATGSIRVYVTGDGTVTAENGDGLATAVDTAGAAYTPVQLVDGVAHLAFTWPSGARRTRRASGSTT